MDPNLDWDASPATWTTMAPILVLADDDEETLHSSSPMSITVTREESISSECPADRRGRCLNFVPRPAVVRLP